MQTTVIDTRDTAEVVIGGRQICIVDDDELYRAHVATLLAQKNLWVVEAADTSELQEILDRRMPDCILLDYDLVSENGLFIIDRLKQRYGDLSPIIMISGDETQRTAVRAFRAGVVDYVGKRGMRLEDLVVAIRRAIGLKIRDEAREQEMERLRRNAHFDEQTGLLMRPALEERLARAVDTTRRVGRPCGLVGFRIPRLQEVQDRFGLVATDRILRTFGQRLRELARSGDLCGVWDRGMFVFVVDADASPKAVASFVQRIREKATLEVDLAAAHLTLTVVAASAVAPDDAETADGLVGVLDGRMAEALRAFGESDGDAKTWVRLPEASTASPAASGQERRRAPRMRTLKQGRIYLNGLQATIDCTVRNLSAGGAGLRLMGPTAIPEFFRLKISDTGTVRNVRKCWHLNNDLGVEFIPD